MPREIKFRAIEKATGKMVNTDKLGRVAFWQMWFQGELILETVSQYVGLKDKKHTKEYPEGQEIYEGDIVRVGAPLFSIRKQYNIPVGLNVVKEVYWASCGFYVDIGVGHGIELTAFPGNIEVLGNIYKNPELLKV